MSKSTVVYDRIWYLPTSLVAKDGSVTLIGHIFKIKRTDTGNILLDNKTNAWEFKDELEMVSFIRKNKACALPYEAEGSPRFVPRRIANMVYKLRAEAQL